MKTYYVSYDITISRLVKVVATDEAEAAKKAKAGDSIEEESCELDSSFDLNEIYEDE